MVPSSPSARPRRVGVPVVACGFLLLALFALVLLGGSYAAAQEPSPDAPAAPVYLPVVVAPQVQDGSEEISVAALVEPNWIKQPGTQPNQVGNLESPNKCDNCHGGYNRAVEPAFNWRGSMMGNAGRDPLFWATLAIAEQDLDGVGDMCIRCHSTGGWYGGRSVPTDGSGLSATGDADGVDCDTCHKMTNPDGSEHAGVFVPPFEPNNGAGQGYYGSGMLALSGGAAKLGPYIDAGARHQFAQSSFHRDVDFCGSCHDVSNPVVGDVAHNNGAQLVPSGVVASWDLTSELATKAAFNNFVFQYGVVERTFSEFMSGGLSKTLVSSYAGLPADLKAGAIKAAYDSAMGDYADGTDRYFSCQTCHMRAVTGYGANKAGIPLRTDLPLHDMTGGNAWAADAILYQNTAGTLRLGGGLTTTQIDALIAGKDRARQQLALASTLSVNGNTLKVTNLTGHKLISGYPEGRRMWLNVVWYDAANTVLREDGQYGSLNVQLPSGPLSVKTLLNPDDPNTRVYEAHYGMTQEWANQLLALAPSSLPLAYDRVTGAVSLTLGQLAGGTAPAEAAETFHFALNNTVTKDNRIPPYGFSPADAATRNALPVPNTLYQNADGSYRYWDDVALNPPAGAAYATIKLMYQSTSWEYIQFLYLANTGANAFLGAEGANLLNAWLNTGMAEPVVMASATWGTPPAPTCATAGTPLNLTATSSRKKITLSWQSGSPAPSGGYRIYYNQAGKLQFRGAVGPSTLTYTDTGLTSRVSYSYVVTAWTDCNGNGVFDVGVDTESPPTAPVSATAG